MSELGERERGERKEKRERELIINVNNQQRTINDLNLQIYIHKSLAFPPTEESIKMLKDADVSAKRDGWSFSHFVAVAIQEYLNHHPLPNPQSQIDRMLEVEMPHKPVTQCCVQGCRGKAKSLLTLKDFNGKTEQFQVCLNHKLWKHPKFRFLVSFREIR